jgi:hypothetical protein
MASMLDSHSAASPVDDMAVSDLFQLATLKTSEITSYPNDYPNDYLHDYPKHSHGYPNNYLVVTLKI